MPRLSCLGLFESGANRWCSGDRPLAAGVRSPAQGPKRCWLPSVLQLTAFPRAPARGSAAADGLACPSLCPPAGESVTDEGLAHLARLKGSLTALDLGYSCWSHTAPGLAALLEHMTGLRMLNIGGWWWMDAWVPGCQQLPLLRLLCSAGLGQCSLLRPGQKLTTCMARAEAPDLHGPWRPCRRVRGHHRRRGRRRGAALPPAARAGCEREPAHDGGGCAPAGRPAGAADTQFGLVSVLQVQAADWLMPDANCLLAGCAPTAGGPSRARLWRVRSAASATASATFCGCYLLPCRNCLTFGRCLLLQEHPAEGRGAGQPAAHGDQPGPVLLWRADRPGAGCHRSPAAPRLAHAAQVQPHHRPGV